MIAAAGEYEADGDDGLQRFAAESGRVVALSQFLDQVPRLAQVIGGHRMKCDLDSAVSEALEAVREIAANRLPKPLTRAN